MESTAVMEQLLKGVAEEELAMASAYTEASGQLNALLKKNPREGVDMLERLYRSIVRETFRVTDSVPKDAPPADTLATLRYLSLLLADVIIAQQLLSVGRGEQIGFFPIVRYRMVRRIFKIGEFHHSVASNSPS